MEVEDVMTAVVLTVGPDDTMRETAVRMTERNVGSAVVREGRGGALVAILTERDLLRAVAARADLDVAPVTAYATAEVTTAAPDTPLEDAAATMLRGGFRHLVVTDGAGAPVGVLSVRDILRVWVAEHLPAM